MKTRNLVSLLVVLGFAAWIPAGCSSGSGAHDAAAPAATTNAAASAPGTDAAPGSSGAVSLRVLAAASLKASFTQMKAAFEAENPSITVQLTTAGSSDLVDQIMAGEPADVFASADEKNMTTAVDAGEASDPQVFATNTMVLAVPADNPAHITSIADLAKPGIKVVMCANKVPCGAAADAVIAATGVTVRPVSAEANVTDVLEKVRSGEADAGFIYATDAHDSADSVTVIDVPQASTVINNYPIAVLNGSANPAAAQAWVSFVTGPKGQAALTSHGFKVP